MIPTFVLVLLAMALAAICWYAFEGRWDRRLFRDGPGQVCRNGPAAEARAFLNAHPDTQVLDVRSAAEFRGGALPGAVHISIADPAFPDKAGSLSRSRPVLVYCAGGYRSRRAVERLKKLNFRIIQHLHRGYHSWKLSGLPVTKPVAQHPEP